ncbi:MAG TPA: MBL fold metallo-hydrolase [Actinomycetota bacterium]|nr:MBL fold metallo-hydrolase [Actinomycetota bacterium]
MEVLTIETPELGDRSYIAHDGRSAIVIDPQRDIDRVMAASGSLAITHVAETHIHNDYVSGGLELAARTGAVYLVSGADSPAFERTPVYDGDTFEVGTLTVRAIATPGHTHHHLSYLVSQDGQPKALFTGGSLLYGTVGRTDLAGKESAEELTRKQYRSVRKLAALIPDEVEIWPTHGFGSFCSSARSSGAMHGSMGDERRSNLALRIQSEDDFVSQLLSGLTAYPRYYAHMSALNLGGPPPVDLRPPETIDGARLRELLAGGGWVVDLSSRRAYARGHIPGTVSVELGKSFATYLGWVLPWGTPLTLLGDSPEEVAEARRQLVRIGIDQLAGAAIGKREELAGGEPLASYEVADFAALSDAKAKGENPFVLDVRRDDERAEGWIDGSVHIPLPDLVARVDELPDDRLWVHCASGFRASIAASLLARNGKTPVLIDDIWADAAKAGVTVTTSRQQPELVATGES